MWWLVAIAVLLLIGFIPLSLRLRYDEQGFCMWLQILPFRLSLVPGAKKKKKKTAKGAKKTATDGKSQKKGGKLAAFLPYVENVLEFLAELPRRLTVRKLEATLILANSDPCDLAVNYGRIWAALGNLMPRLESMFRIRKREMQVECDFMSEETKVFFTMDIALTVGRLLSMIVFHGSRILRKYITIMNKEREESNHE
ncbi:MAG: DUF2953 domain-containing protein [Oscillospiraceae bacterium]|nr:DUF2953 domain-containing protein [Oscillospiraceae bacterium]